MGLNLFLPLHFLIHFKITRKRVDEKRSRLLRIMKNILFETNRLIVRKLSLDDVEFLFRYSQEKITKKELPYEVFENS